MKERRGHQRQLSVIISGVAGGRDTAIILQIPPARGHIDRRPECWHAWHRQSINQELCLTAAARLTCYLTRVLSSILSSIRNNLWCFSYIKYLHWTHACVGFMSRDIAQNGEDVASLYRSCSQALILTDIELPRGPTDWQECCDTAYMQ